VNETVVTVVGNVATELRPSSSASGADLATFRIASTSRRFDRTAGSWVDAHTNYATVVCWRALARHVLASLHKGQPVVVTGKLHLKSWEKDGRSGLTAEIEAVAVGHDLSRGTSVFTKWQREAAAVDERPLADALVAEQGSAAAAEPVPDAAAA
jgi:single-strand DNA-binding protein